MSRIQYANIEIVFSYDEKDYYGNDNIQLIITDELFILAVLNSKFIHHILQQIADKVRGGFYRLKIIYIEQLPIPPATEEQKAPIVEHVEKILVAKENSTAGFDSAQPANRPLSEVEGDIPALEAEIDRLVYALYGLSEEEIPVVVGRETNP